MNTIKIYVSNQFHRLTITTTLQKDVKHVTKNYIIKLDGWTRILGYVNNVVKYDLDILPQNILYN